MAAPMRTCLLNTSLCQIVVLRRYSGRLKRRASGILTSKDDTDKIKQAQAQRIVNPKKNPYLPYNPDDPIQKGLLRVVNEREEIVSRQMKEQTFQQSDIYNVKKFPQQKKNDASRKDETVVQSIARLKDTQKRLDQKEDFRYKWLEKSDPKIGGLILRSSSKKCRHDHREIVVEGKHGVWNAVQTGAVLKSLYFSGTDTLDFFSPEDLENVAVYKVRHDIVKICTEAEKPDGVLGVFEMPEIGEIVSPTQKSIPVTLVCDGIREPRQLGMLLHSAAVIGCQQVITTKGSCDVWSPKVLRTAACSQFKLPIYNGIPWSKVNALLPSGDDVKLYITHAKYQQDQLHNQTGSLDAVERIEKMKQLELYEEEETIAENEADESNSDSDVEETLTTDTADKNQERQFLGKKKKMDKTEQFIESLAEDSSYESSEVLTVYKDAPLNVANCDSLSVGNGGHVVLVVSGAKEAVSAEAKKLAYDGFGEYLTIPSQMGEFEMTVSASIMMYEISKKLRES